MSRGLNSTAVTALSAKEVEIYFAVELQFQTATLRLWSGVGELFIDSELYTGGGAMIGLSRIDETFEISSRGAQVSLSGIPRGELEVMNLAYSDNYQGRTAKIMLCIQDADSPRDLTDLSVDHGSVFDTIFTGFMDVLQIEESGETSNITLSIESRLVQLQRPKNIRYTHQYQTSRFSGDLGLEYTNSTPLLKMRWGR